MSPQKTNRPPLSELLCSWQAHLAENGLPADCLWIFTENLVFESASSSSGTLYQTRFSPVPEDALEAAYGAFASTDAPIIFYQLGISGGRSLCLLLCDHWFDKRIKEGGFKSLADWGIAFHCGGPGNIEEITDLGRWVRRDKCRRTPCDLDFAMSLATVDEIRLYGRPLMPYERFAENIIGRLRRLLGNPE